MIKYKAGDRVRIIRNDYTHYFKIGDIVLVKRVHRYIVAEGISSRSGMTIEQYLKRNEIELVSETKISRNK